MEYIEASRAPESARPFTDLPALGDDRAALIVFRGRLSYLMLNRFPYAPGHLLAIPFRETGDIEDLSSEESADLFQSIILAKKLLRLTIKPDAFNVGFNLGAASGGSIGHLHCHIVPRWHGDNNFMPVISHTRVLPQALGTMWEKLRAAAQTAGAARAAPAETQGAKTVPRSRAHPARNVPPPKNPRGKKHPGLIHNR